MFGSTALPKRFKVRVGKRFEVHDPIATHGHSDVIIDPNRAAIRFRKNSQVTFVWKAERSSLDGGDLYDTVEDIGGYSLFRESTLKRLLSDGYFKRIMAADERRAEQKSKNKKK